MGEPKKVRFILASKSPRRKKLLAEAGYEFRVQVSNVDESAFETEKDAFEHAKKLALAKARDVAARYPAEIVLAADTVVECEGSIIGKATDEKHAEQIIRKLFTRPHKVITAVAVIRLADDIRMVETDTTVVYPVAMTNEQIIEHVKSGVWRDKAGAYGIQEGGDRFVKQIEGSYTNIMGLPMERVGRILNSIS
jgi:septum formation protein